MIFFRHNICYILCINNVWVIIYFVSTKHGKIEYIRKIARIFVLGIHEAIFWRFLSHFFRAYYHSRPAKVNNRFCGEGYKSLRPTRLEVELCTFSTPNEF